MLKWLLGLLILGFGLLIGIYFYFNQEIHRPISIDGPILYKVKSGQSAKGLLNDLKSRNIIDENIGLKIQLKLFPQLAQIKVGTYKVLPSMTSLELLELFSRGQESQFSISLVEGLRWRDWLKSLHSHKHLKFEPDFEKQLSQFISNIPQQSIEGLLLPDTYYFVDQSSPMEIIERAYSSMQSYLALAWQNRALGLPYETPYQGLIMASIIEKETGVAEERPRIAGVFVNRLNMNMRLQTDPTVIYGMGDNFDGDIRRKDLRTATPYNTYVIKGLPPTPIAMPSKLAIDAAFNPLETDDLYFVAKGDGSHQFSETLQEHNIAVRKYQLKK